MADNASVAEIATIRSLASNPDTVMTTQTVVYDLMALGLTKDDICAEIVSWIDGGKRVKLTKLNRERK